MERHFGGYKWPLRRIAYSLLTVILSGQIIGFIQKLNAKERLH